MQTVVTCPDRDAQCDQTREIQDRYRRAFDDAPIGMVIVGLDGRFLDANRAFRAMVGRAEDDLLDMTIFDITHPDDRAASRDALRRAPSAETASFALEQRYLNSRGQTLWAQVSASVARDGRGDPLYLIGQVQDVTAQKQTEEALQEALAKYRTLVEQIPASTYIAKPDDAGQVLYQSPQFAHLLGYSQEEWQSLADPAAWQEHLHPEDRDLVMGSDAQSVITGEPYQLEYRFIGRDGQVVWVRDEGRLVRDANGQPICWQGITIDITERKSLEDRLAYQARHDPLTGLPNRRHLSERLDQALARVEERGSYLALLFLDLDNFKALNDRFGHDAGDAALVQMAERLRQTLRSGDSVARLAGDEFIILLEDVGSPAAAAEAAERIRARLREPIPIQDAIYTLTASIGLVVTRDPSTSARELLRRSDEAMYQAKADGKDRWSSLDSRQAA